MCNSLADISTLEARERQKAKEKKTAEENLPEASAVKFIFTPHVSSALCYVCERRWRSQKSDIGLTENVKGYSLKVCYSIFLTALLAFIWKKRLCVPI